MNIRRRDSISLTASLSPHFLELYELENFLDIPRQQSFVGEQVLQTRILQRIGLRATRFEICEHPSSQFPIDKRNGGHIGITVAVPDP